MRIWEAIVMGLVQGITEFLPISSSGHLALAQKIFHIETGGDLFFETILHVGTLIAVFAAFQKTIFTLVREAFVMGGKIVTGKFRWASTSGSQRMLVYLLVSLLPLAVMLFLKDHIEAWFNSVVMIGVALILNSIILLVSDYLPERNKKGSSMTFRDAIIIGLVQTIAVIPGISRSGSTITAGLACGLKRPFAARYSFILSIPTILGAAVLQIFDAVEKSFDFTLIPAYLVGMLTAALSGFLAIKLLEYILKSKRFIIFAVYSFTIGGFAVLSYIFT